MTMYAEAPPEKKKGGLGWLKGCCIGCACALVLLIIALIIILNTAFGMRPSVPAETFLTPKASMFAVAQLTPDNEDLVKVLQEHIKQQAAQGKAAGPQAEAEQVKDNLAQLLPAHAVLILARNEGEEGEGGVASTVLGGKFKANVAVSANPTGFGGRIIVAMVRWMLSLTVSTCEQEGGSVQTYKEVKIGVKRDKSVVAAVDNNFMMGDDVELTKEWIDRIAAQKEAQKKAGKKQQVPAPAYEGPEEMKRMYGRLDHKAVLNFVCTNTRGEIKSLLGAMEKAEPRGQAYDTIEKAKETATVLGKTDIGSDSVIVAGGTMRITGPDTAGFEILIECKDAQFAQKLAGQFKEALEASAKDTGIQDIEATADGAVVKIKYTKPGLQKILQDATQQ